MSVAVKPVEERIIPKLLPLVVPIDTLRPHPKNPNVGRTDLLVESLVASKQFKPIVYGRGGIILGGNHTYFGAMELGWPDLAAVYVDVDWDSEEGKRITLADNEIGRRSTTEDGLLAELLQSMDRPTVGTGYDDELLAKLLERIDQPLNFGEDGVQEEKEPVTFDIFSQATVLDDAFRHYRAAGFPSFKKTRFAMMQEINKLASLADDQLVGTSVAHHVADCYHMHRFAVRVTMRQTPIDQFNKDDDLRHGLKLTSEKGTITDEALLNTITYVHGAQVASNFRPGYALSLVKRFCPDDGVWLDTSAGYGGRLVAFMASKRKHYIGIDPSSESVRGNEQLVGDLGFADRVTLIQQPAEDVQLNEGFCDFAFTSPPYFGKEMYTDEDTQSWKRYHEPESWRVGFLLPTFRLQYRALRAGSYAVMNIADVDLQRGGHLERGTVYPLVEWARQCAREVGFDYVTEEKLPLGRVPGQGESQQRFEPVLIWRKP